MIQGRPYALRVFSAVLIVASLVLATALVVEVASVHYQANLDETGRLEAFALLLSDRYVAAVHAGSPAAPVVHGNFPAGLRLTILDAGGSAVADSRFDPRSITNRIADPEVKQAAAGDVGVAVSYRIESGQRERTVCVAIKDTGLLIGFAVASSPVGLTWQSASGTFSWALPLLLVVGALWLVLAVILVRVATRPISDLTDALERRSMQSLAGLAMRADVTELGRAQRASYALLRESEVLVERERSQSSALSAVLDAVPQAIVILDNTGAMALPRIKADFVTNASHELKTPLTAIRGYLELLREEPGNVRYLDIVQRNVDRLIALSSDISLLSRLENKAPEIELVDVSELQHDLAELFDKQGRETGVALRFSVDSEGRFLYGDRLMLLQMFINLIENAYHFTQAGAITVSATADVSHIILSVSDTGQGIPAKDLPRIFERFYSRASDHGRPGTGLGLAIVKRIVFAHNGTIDVESTVNKGTTFVIHIPKNLGPRRPAATSGQPSDTKREDL